MEPTNRRSKAKGNVLHRPCGRELGCSKQEFREAADINFIVRKYRMTGQLDAMTRGEVVFGDDAGYKTYADAYAALEKAKEQFLKLPPEIRLELGNDPGRYRELSSEEGIRRVLGRMGERQRHEMAKAMRMVRAAQPPASPPSPASSSAEGSKAAPPGPPVADEPLRRRKPAEE